MVKGEWKHTMYSLTARGKIGRRQGYGQGAFGESQYADQNQFAGVYKKQYTKNGPLCIKTKFQKTVAVNTDHLVVHQAKFANAVSSWHSLTSNDKEYYNTLKYPLHMAGFNRYISLYMKDLI